MNKKLIKELKKEFIILKSIKIIAVNLLALVGCSFILYHFAFGQPYQCAKYYDEDSKYITTEMQFDLLQQKLNMTILISKQCSTDLREMTYNYNHIADDCKAYCLKEVFEPICNREVDLYEQV